MQLQIFGGGGGQAACLGNSRSRLGGAAEGLAWRALSSRMLRGKWLTMQLTRTPQLSGDPVCWGSALGAAFRWLCSCTGQAGCSLVEGGQESRGARSPARARARRVPCRAEGGGRCRGVYVATVALLG